MNPEDSLQPAGDSLGPPPPSPDDALAEDLRLSEERLRLALDAGQMGVWDWDLATGGLTWSDSLEPIHGLAPGTFGGTFEDFAELIHPEDRERVHQAISQAIASVSSYDVEMRCRRPDGGVHWVSGKGKVLAGPDGKAARMVGVCQDITRRKRSEQHGRFLAAASAELAVLVDHDETLRKVASLAVPHFADWAAVDVLTDEGTLRRVGVAHVDPEKVALARDYHRRFSPDRSQNHGVWKILRSGEPELVTRITDEMLVESLGHGERLEIIRKLGLRSYIGVPLKVRGRTVGVLTFIVAESGVGYDERDLAVAWDLAGRAAIAIENAGLYQELREADQRKDEFLATLAHELRNPLAPLRNALQILGMERVDAATARQVHDMMGRQVDQLARLVDDLLDVSRVMRGKIELRHENIELATAIARAVETCQPLVDTHGHSLTIDVPDGAVPLHADPVRLVQIFGNLLSNAARYTPPGGSISVTARREAGQAVVSIRDNGIGIEAAMVPKVFDLFVQAEHGPASGAHSGLGIGLTLVRNLVEMHGGSVEARSAGLGSGSEFVVKLPLAAAPPPSRPKGEAGDRMPARARPEGASILVVDDNRDAALSFAMLLELQGHEVRVVHDGPAALREVAAWRPALVFLDLGMPEMDGCEVARQLRRLPGLESVVLVALTGWGQEDDRRRTGEAGFDHHLVKPPDPKAVSALLEGLANRRSHSPAAAATCG